MHIYWCMDIYVCITCVNSYIWKTMCKGTCMYTHACIHMHILAHTCKHIYTHMYTYRLIYTCMVYTHTHTHRHISSLERVTYALLALVVIYWAHGLGQELETLVVPTSSPPGSHCEYRNLNQSVRPRAFSWLASASLPSLFLWERHLLTLGKWGVWTCPRRAVFLRSISGHWMSKTPSSFFVSDGLGLGSHLWNS